MLQRHQYFAKKKKNAKKDHSHGRKERFQDYSLFLIITQETTPCGALISSNGNVV